MSKQNEESKRKVPIEFEAPVEETQSEPQDAIDTDIEALEREIESLRKSVDETQSSYLRVMADFDNYRKRQREEIARMAGSAKEEIVFRLLPLMDNLERTLQAAEAEHSFDSLLEGANLTLRQVREMLAREGLEPIEAVGQEFNPEFHEALMRVDTDEYPENTIIDELEKGYTLNGRVLRPARVRVAARE